ncbi:unnamed protein product [Cylindrotheca closterium]|uniref:UBA domain-containing protein n=1 Tax=Cylindrotheca closterium TaxID=2856 RepID=A0AAD2FF64_9STRA|nr:unnamed protein product [Cylindrotheca closterium]
MFRRLADRVFNSSTEQQNVNTLKNMGFSEADARNALQQTDGNLEQAANILLARGPSTQHNSSSAPARDANRQQVEDDELQRALQASMMTTSTTTPQLASRNALPKPAPKRKPKTAAATNAGKAALTRANTPPNSAHSSRSSSPAISSHPNVKVPTKLSNKSKEEQILRTADRLKSSPSALDTLYKTLKTLQSNPTHPKFRRIDQTTAGYQKSLANAPGAEDLLLAMNYRKSNGHILTLELADPATLYLGISALEQTRLTPEYLYGKSLQQFHKELRQAFHSADNSAQEAIARSQHMSKLPTEPTMGGAWIFVNFEGLEQDSQYKLKRKFDADDTLGDALHWIAGNGTEILTKLQSGEWELVDGNRHPPACLDVSNASSRTLQYIGCWPSGKLIIRPKSSTNDGMDAQQESQQPSHARGLGAAPMLD